MSLAQVGQHCKFIDHQGRECAAQIIAVHEPEHGTRKKIDPATGTETETDETFEIRGERVDLIYASKGVGLNSKKALRKNHALHKSQQTSNADGALLNYWVEAK